MQYSEESSSESEVVNNTIEVNKYSQFNHESNNSSFVNNALNNFNRHIKMT